MKKFFSILMAVMLATRGLGADAANDLILSQRKADNSGSIQRNVAPTARGFFTFDGSKIPASTTDLTYTTPTLSVPDAFNISSAGSVTITGGGSNKSINFLPSGTGTVGIGLVNSPSGARVVILDANASTSPDLNSWLNGGNQITTFSEATGGILLNLAGSTNVRPTVALKKSRGTLAVPTAVVDGDQLGQLIFQGYDGNPFGFSGGTITSKVDGTVAPGIVPTRFDFNVITPVAGTQLALTLRSDGSATFSAAQPSSVSSTPGTAAGNVFTVSLPTGGNSTITTTGTGGTGGATFWQGGNGGTAALATTASTGGAGGLWRIAGGNGGAAAVTGSGTGTGGKGGGVQIATGNGGAVSTSTGVNLGGAGGDWTQTSGNGGNASGGSSNTGGSGGAINITTGNGGTGATAAGNSGTLTLNTGTSGAGGTVGSIILKTGGTTALTINASQQSTFAGNVTVSTGGLTLSGTSSITGGAGNMTITAGTGASRTLALQTTTSGSTATTFLSGDASQNTTISKLITSYNGISTAGNGVVAIVKATRVTAQSAANSSICTYTTPASDGSYEVSANMNVTASTTLSTTLTCTYTDESNTARTLILPVTGLTGSFVALGSISGAGASVWETPVMHIRCKASTAITILTSAGTFSGVTYTAEGIIKQTQ